MPRKLKLPASKACIDRMVRRIVKKFKPDQVILFGSHARGDAGPDSDVDLLVVMPVEGSVREKRIEIRLAVREYHGPLDVILTTPEKFAWRKDIVGTIEYPASREGKVLYART
ncbi:MAG: nucleotidyltransferase domain-containing protein [Gemmataceae bacterium]|nr:nucleotidyltransferase domain-containing protein [Gemmataceae bacterium]